MTGARTCADTVDVNVTAVNSVAPGSSRNPSWRDYAPERCVGAICICRFDENLREWRGDSKYHLFQDKQIMDVTESRQDATA